MEETDVGRVLAVAVPETVPVIGDLADRARALGRRRRARRVVFTGGGAGIAMAAAVAVVVTLGGGSGAASGSGAGSGGSGISVEPGGAVATSTGLPSSPPPGSLSSPPVLGPGSGSWPGSPGSSGSPGSKPSRPIGTATHDPVADGKVLAAVKAALPAKDANSLKLYRSGTSSTGYGAEFTMGQTVLDVSVARFVKEQPGDTPTLCTSDPQHCTKSTATLRGHQVRWEYYNGGLSTGAPSLNVYDDQAGITFLVSATGQNTAQLPSQAEMKDVGLNEQVATALLDAWPGH